MNEVIEFAKEHWNDVLAVYGAVVAICTVIVKYTPTEKDDVILTKIIKFFDFFSTAFSKADAKKLEKAEKK